MAEDLRGGHDVNEYRADPDGYAVYALDAFAKAAQAGRLSETDANESVQFDDMRAAAEVLLGNWTEIEVGALAHAERFFAACETPTAEPAPASLDVRALPYSTA